jgi:hypothetical protein
MANRTPPPSLQRYWIWALILIVVALIVYTAARGLSTPGPGVVGDSGAAPVVHPQ